MPTMTDIDRIIVTARRDSRCVSGAETRALCDEIDRLRAALAPFADAAKGIPDNWPGWCKLRIDDRGNGMMVREVVSYHSCGQGGALLPTIDQWRAARAAWGQQ